MGGARPQQPSFFARLWAFFFPKKEVKPARLPTSVRRGDDRERALVRQAEDALKAGKVSEAADAYEQAAKSYLNAGHQLKALAVLNLVVRLRPDDLGTLQAIADCHRQLDRRRDAALAFYRIAQIRQSRGEIAEAEASYQIALELGLLPGHSGIDLAAKAAAMQQEEASKSVPQSSAMDFEADEAEQDLPGQSVFQSSDELDFSDEMSERSAVRPLTAAVQSALLGPAAARSSSLAGQPKVALPKASLPPPERPASRVMPAATLAQDPAEFLSKHSTPAQKTPIRPLPRRPSSLPSPDDAHALTLALNQAALSETAEEEVQALTMALAALDEDTANVDPLSFPSEEEDLATLFERGRITEETEGAPTIAMPAIHAPDPLPPRRGPPGGLFNIPGGPTQVDPRGMPGAIRDTEHEPTFRRTQRLKIGEVAAEATRMYSQEELQALLDEEENE